MSMIKTIPHFFKIHRKMIFRNPAIVVQDMFGIRFCKRSAKDEAHSGNSIESPLTECWGREVVAKKSLEKQVSVTQINMV